MKNITVLCRLCKFIVLTNKKLRTMNIFKNKKNYVIARSLKNEVVSELGTIKYTLEDAEKLCAGLNKRKQNIAYLFVPFCETQDDYKNVFIELETR